MRVVAIIQARVQSTRLPGKVLLPLRQQPVVSHIIERLSFCDKVTDTVLAVPDDEENTVLRKLALSAGVDYCTGPLDDVLERYLKAAKASEADFIVRVTGDSPLICPYIVDVTVEAVFEGGNDYAVMRGTPLGIEPEVMTKDALEKIDKLAGSQEMREHPTLAVFENPKHFKTRILKPPEGYARPEYRLTLDTKQDYILLRDIYDNVEPRQGYIRLGDVFDYLDANPELASANKDVEQTMHDFLKARKEAIANAGPADRAPRDK
jgi:spore coat polysaccharide biosynthesis protein SpsF